MARTVARNSSTLPLMQEEEESGDSGVEQAAPLFVHANGESVQFAFYGLSEGQEVQLTHQIEMHGGEVIDNLDYADTILCLRENYEDLKYLYDFDTKVYVEEISFVRRCIAQRKYYHHVPLPKGMGGRPRGSHLPLTKFNEDDVENLCLFLAQVIPDPRNGGRTGRGVYQKQIDIARGRPDNYSLQWIMRHSAESWRTFYKVHAAELDPRIEFYALEARLPANGKGQYHLNRRYRIGVGFVDVQEEEEEEREQDSGISDEDDDIQIVDNRQPVAHRGRKRPQQELSFVSGPRTSDSRPQKRRRVDEVLTPVDDLERGRTVRNSNLSYSFQTSGRDLLDDPTLLTMNDHISMESPSWQPDPNLEQQAGPSGTRHTPVPEEITTVVLPHRKSEVAPPRVAKNRTREIFVASRDSQIPVHPSRRSEIHPTTQLYHVPPQQNHRLSSGNQTNSTAGLPPKARIKARKLKAQRVPSAVMMPPPAPGPPQSSQATLVGPEPTQRHHEIIMEAQQEQRTKAPQTLQVANREIQTASKPQITQAAPPKTIRSNRNLPKSNRVVNQNTPARNTRSRGASVEVTIVDPAPQDTIQPLLEPVGEDGEEPSGEPFPVEDVLEGNSNEEAEVVEQLDPSVGSEPDPEALNSMAKSMFGNSTLTSLGVLSDNDDDDDEFINQSLKRPITVKRAVPSKPAAVTPGAQGRSTRRDGGNQNIPANTKTGRTTRKNQLTRKFSDRTTEEEVFPSLGTRARKVVDELESLPYTPMRGTRAYEARRRNGNLP